MTRFTCGSCGAASDHTQKPLLCYFCGKQWTDQSLPPFQAHSDTSREAAIEQYPRAGTLRRRVLDHLQQVGAEGATDDEIQVALEMNPSTQRPRRVELERAGLIERLDATRKTRAGRQAHVYVTSD